MVNEDKEVGGRPRLEVEERRMGRRGTRGDEEKERWEHKEKVGKEEGYEGEVQMGRGGGGAG